MCNSKSKQRKLILSFEVRKLDFDENTKHCTNCFECQHKSSNFACGLGETIEKKKLW